MSHPEDVCFSHSRAFVQMASLRAVTAGMSRSLNSSTVAICIAVGNVSLDDWLISTSSLGWIGFLLPRVPSTSWMSSIADDFINVHIRLSARAGLPNIEWEFAVQFASYHLIRNSCNLICFPSWHVPGYLRSLGLSAFFT